MGLDAGDFVTYPNSIRSLKERTSPFNVLSMILLSIIDGSFPSGNLLRCVSCSRIAYQESSQTFGVITMRVDIQDSNGATPARPSASTLAQNTSSSFTGAKLIVSSGIVSSLTERMFGEEVEVSSLLVLDQHTFEGTVTVFW